MAARSIEKIRQRASAELSRKSSGQALLRQKATDGQALRRIRLGLRLSSAERPHRRQRSGQALRQRSGQAMLLTVIMTSGILFLVTSVAGILMFYQLQQVTDIGNSAAAVFAADAALEKATYNYLKSTEFVYDPTKPCFVSPRPPSCLGPTVSLSNGASGSSYLVIPPPGTPNATTVITAEGKGPGGRTVRLLQTTFFVNP
ncbi:MAG: hypothetical protein V1696_01355 [Candidatus Jorgensenbacteria bacterium]